MPQDLARDLASLAPELTLAVTMGLALVLDLLFRPAERRLTAWLVLAGLALAASQVLRSPAGAVLCPCSHAAGAGPERVFSGMLVVDSLSAFFKLVFLAAAAASVVLGYRSRDIDRARHGEYHLLILGATIGMFLMASSGDLVMVYLAVEMLSQAAYVLAGYIGRDPRSSEGALKYVLYGGVASGAMIFGISILYGLTGATGLDLIGAQLAGSTETNPAVLVAFLLILVGLGFKVAMVPFHMWSPDVYEGSPTPVTAFLSVGSKAAGFAILARVILEAASSPLPAGGAWAAIPGFSWRELLAVLAVVTMTVGNLSAIGQRSVKRLLAFSSVAHAGYMLAALAAATSSGLSSILFYLVVYCVMNVGAFYVVVLVGDAAGRDDDRDYAGLGWRQPFLATAMSIFLISLVGLPPTAGFLGKWYLFSALVETQSWKMMLLALAAVANSVVSLYYYAGIIRRMWLDPSPEGARPAPVGILQGAILAALAVASAYPFGYGAKVLDAAVSAARTEGRLRR